MKKDPTKQKFMGKSLLPFGQHVTTPEKHIAMTDFPDMEEMNRELEAYLMEKASEKLALEGKQSSAKSTKIHHVDAWDIPSAQFIDQRAQAFFRAITGLQTSVVDLSWANIYQKGDYILPHAHSRSTGSLVYVVSMGDEDDRDPMSGKFVISDPRLGVCCQADGTYMSNNFMPGFKAGSMIVFPSTVVHMVTPYQGNKPRITIAWNINDKALPKRSASESVGIPPHPGKAKIRALR
ncbi:putative 2OG-Fe(II) oxygenase [Sneathiella sp.]|uniref:putative 2OG-Fe(II) oxygenase n=1 Tax=Sneathiella sp. TaxID=1964365 RepID=UPI0039E3D41D